MARFKPHDSLGDYFLNNFTPKAVREWVYSSVLRNPRGFNKNVPISFDYELGLSFEVRRALQKDLFKNHYLGGLNPLFDIGKDFVDTIKPYKSGYYILRDFLQPLRGIGNVLGGVLTFALAPIAFLIDIAKCVIRAIRNKHSSNSRPNYSYSNNSAESAHNESHFDFVTEVKICAVQFASRMSIELLAMILKGVLQIVATPFNLLFRMPLRGIITLVKGGMPTIEASLSKQVEKTTGTVDNLEKNSTSSVNELVKVDRALHDTWRKFMKYSMRGQKTNKEINTLPNVPPSFAENISFPEYLLTCHYSTYVPRIPTAEFNDKILKSRNILRFFKAVDEVAGQEAKKNDDMRLYERWNIKPSGVS